MTNNKAYDFSFKINKTMKLLRTRLWTLSILLEQYCDTQTYEWHRNLKIALRIILTPEPHSPVLDSEAFSSLMSVTNLFSINWYL